MLAAPATASAHGPVNPAATSYLATIRHVPPGLDAKVVDGDQRMWLQVSPSQTVIVLDYRGAPYLRFWARGVQVNHNSSMYYLNQVPPELVPPNIGPRTPPSWASVRAAIPTPGMTVACTRWRRRRPRPEAVTSASGAFHLKSTAARPQSEAT